MLFRSPTYIRDFFVVGDLENDYKDGLLKVDVSLTSLKGQDRDLIVETSLFEKGKRLWAETKEARFADNNINVQFDKQLPGIKQWSAEKPDLYSLVISLREKSGRILESVSTKVGFRKVEIMNSQLHVNGIPLLLKGTNLHEHDDIEGHVISEAVILKDIKVMKSNNINAVRTSHYPQQELWYEMCDKYGLYLIDEANIESHGIGYDKDVTLADKPEWAGAHLSRMQNMVEQIGRAHV